MGRRLPILYSALLLTVVNLLLRLGGTSFQVYLSGRIGPAGIGLLQLVLSVSGLAMTAAMAGVRTATMYLCAQELGKGRPGNVRWVLAGCFTYSIAISTALCLSVSAFAPTIARAWVGDERTVGAIRLFAAFLPVSCLCGVMTGYFTAANRIGTLAAVEIAEQLFSVSITLLLLHFYSAQDPAAACRAVVLGSSLGACLTLGCLVILRLREHAPVGPRLRVSRQLLGTALPLALADDLKAGISTTENLMVPKRLALFRGEAAPLAAFGTVCGMVFPVLMFPAAIIYALAELLIPELARCAAAGHRRRIYYLVGRSLKICMLYGCLFSGLMFLWAKPLCMALYGNARAGYYLRLYAPMIPMLYCDAITDAMTKGLGQQTICVRYNILTSAMDVAGLYLLLPKYGMLGYLWSFFVTHLINFLLSLGRLLKITGKRLPFKQILLGGLCTLASVALASQAQTLAVRCVSFPVSLGCLLYLCGILRKADLRWIKGLVRLR